MQGGGEGIGHAMVPPRLWDISPRPPMIRTLGLPSVPAAGAVAAGSAGGALSLMADKWQQCLEQAQDKTSATVEGGLPRVIMRAISSGNDRLQSKVYGQQQGQRLTEEKTRSGCRYMT